MTPRLGSWDELAAFALTLPDTAAATYYGQPAIKVAANGRPVVTPSREPGSFVLHIDRDTKAILIDTDSASFWQTPHYEGRPGLLVRYASDDPQRIAAMVGRARDQAAARKPAAARKGT